MSIFPLKKLARKGLNIPPLWKTWMPFWLINMQCKLSSSQAQGLHNIHNRVCKYRQRGCYSTLCSYIYRKISVAMMPNLYSVTSQWIVSLIARFMGPTWGPSGADRTQVGPMLALWTLLSGMCRFSSYQSCNIFFILFSFHISSSFNKYVLLSYNIGIVTTRRLFLSWELHLCNDINFPRYQWVYFMP